MQSEDQAFGKARAGSGISVPNMGITRGVLPRTRQKQEAFMTLDKSQVQMG